MDFDYFSDMYKEVYGVRPRGIQPTEQLIAELQAELDLQLAEDKADYLESIAIAISCGAKDKAQAIRWMDQWEYDMGGIAYAI